MVSKSSNPTVIPQQQIKIVVAGGFGVGKTTTIGSVSEITPLRTEERITTASVGIDDVNGLKSKEVTTVAMDFGRITMDDLIVYLFGTPGQERFWFIWDDLMQGAIGAVVLVDTRDLEKSFAAVDFFEQRKLPFIVAVNCFDGKQTHSFDAICEALDPVDPTTPIEMFDARDSASVCHVLITLLNRLISDAQAVNA